MKLDEDRLSAWLNGRVGYGRLGAPLWFMGMEEACGELAELPLRLVGDLVEDLHEAHRRLAPRYDRLFAPRPPLQPTWRRLLALQAIIAGGDHTSAGFKETLRHAQSSTWGRSAGDVLLAELLPLPSPSTTTWHYQAHPRFPELGARPDYERVWLPRRVAMFRSLWEKQCAGTRVVVAYGKGNWPLYKEVFGTGPWAPFAADGADAWALVKRTEGRVVALAPHPVAYGGDAAWHALGMALR